MEYDSLFVQTRWQILHILAYRAASPLEISQEIEATVSHVSQQLKFLEALGIVKKKKVVNRDKGKPRMLFSLAHDYGYLNLLTDGFAEKKLFVLDDHYKTILRMLFINGISFNFNLVRFYCSLGDSLEKIDAILFDRSKKELIILSDSIPYLKKRLESLIKRFKGEVDGFSCSFSSPHLFLKKDKMKDVLVLKDSGIVSDFLHSLKEKIKKEVDNE